MPLETLKPWGTGIILCTGLTLQSEPLLQAVRHGAHMRFSVAARTWSTDAAVVAAAIQRLRVGSSLHASMRLRASSPTLMQIEHAQLFLDNVAGRFCGAFDLFASRAHGRFALFGAVEPNRSGPEDNAHQQYEKGFHAPLSSLCLIARKSNFCGCTTQLCGQILDGPIAACGVQLIGSRAMLPHCISDGS